MKEVKNITVLGAGAMGATIAAIAAEAGAEIVYLGAIDTEVQHVKSISTWQDQLRELRSLW